MVTGRLRSEDGGWSPGGVLLVNPAGEILSTELLGGLGRAVALGLDHLGHEQVLAVVAQLLDRLPDVVILLHGLGRSRSSWDSLETSLHRDGFRVVDFGYASTRATIDEHADALHHVITHLDNVEHISFVGHSLGNLVVRRYLAKYPPRANERPEHKRMVMLGPPNQGAELARRLRDNAIFYLFGGEPGQQLAREWQDVEPLLATPEFEFGILAGGEDSDFSNPLVRGEDDLIVSLEETRLPGAVDFRHVESMHTFMPWNEEVMRMTRHFLAEGNFESHATRQPIAREPADPFRR